MNDVVNTVTPSSDINKNSPETTPPPTNPSSSSAAQVLPSSSVDNADSADIQAARAESVRRLVDEITRLSLSKIAANNNNSSSFNGKNKNNNLAQKQNNQDHDELLLAATVSAAIERGLDREFHTEVVSGAQQSASQISQISHEHSDTFLNSVSKVVALVGMPCSQLETDIQEQNETLQNQTGKEMVQMVQTLQEYRIAEQKARSMQSMILACHKVASLLERARKQAALCRPRAALDAVDEARACLTAPVTGENNGTHKKNKNAGGTGTPATSTAGGGSHSVSSNSTLDEKGSIISNPNSGNHPSGGMDSINYLNDMISLEDTPFGKRAMEMLPKIENEVLMGTKRGLNRWFISLRSGGVGSKAGAAALRKCASSMAIGGPGSLGLGGKVQGYEWRAMNADNLIARVGKQNHIGGRNVGGRVAKAARMGYWYDRECCIETDRLQAIPVGMVRRAEAFATAFGWYRCWEENSPIGVEISLEDEWNKKNSEGKKDVRQTVASSSLGFRRSSGGVVQQTQKSHTQWATALTPAILFEDSPSSKEDGEKLASIPESVHPVRLAESGFGLLGRLDEFRTYYEQNRYGDMKIGSSSADGTNSETRSSLSSLTGDDVSLGTDRVFFAKSLPHLCASVVGFSAVEAALEIGTFEEEENLQNQHSVISRSTANVSSSSLYNNNSSVATASTRSMTTQQTSSFIYRFLESSAKHERSLIAELGKILRRRAVGATLAELTRGSCLMAAFRSALKVVHPSSATRKSDKELFSMDVDIIMTALKVAQEEQLKATKKTASEDIRLEPMRKQATNRYMLSKKGSNRSMDVNIPAEEVPGFPFGLDNMVKSASKTSEDLDEMDLEMRSTTNASEVYTFSYCLPPILRSIHARAIAFAAFALSQQELGQVFAGKIAGYVLDCVEACISVTIVSMKEVVVTHGEDITVDKAVQLNLNLKALQGALPRLFGTLMRGMCHVGMIRTEQLEETFQLADSRLSAADKACEQEIGNLYTLLDDACKAKIDTLINFSLDNFQWVTKIERNMPNAYTESLIEFMRTTFGQMKSLDEGSKAGLHFSCFGQIAERLISLLTDKAETKEDWLKKGAKGLPPIAKIDAMGIKNLELDISEFQKFAVSTGVPQLEHCFNELKSLTSALLDKDLPMLIQPTNASLRQRKYPFLNLDLLGNMLEKYVGMGLGMKMMATGGNSSNILIMEKKDVALMLKVIRSQR